MHNNNEISSNGYKILIKLIIIISGVLIGFLISRMFIIPFTSNDIAMEPNIKAGDKILVLKHTTPATGDIILINNPVEPDRVLLKRVLATEGESIEIRNKILYKNNQRYQFKWETSSNDKRNFSMGFSLRDNMPAVKLNRNEFFVISDNLDLCYDSRTFGLIKIDKIIGKLIYKY